MSKYKSGDLVKNYGGLNWIVDEVVEGENYDYILKLEEDKDELFFVPFYAKECDVEEVSR